MDRSLFSSRYCFVEKMLANGMLHQAMYSKLILVHKILHAKFAIILDILQEWYEFIHEHHKIQCDLIVYLRTSPEVAYERIKKRARNEESCIPFDYLKDLHDLHEKWLIDGKCYRPGQVLVLDANLDLENITEEYVRSELSILKPIMIESNNQRWAKQETSGTCGTISGNLKEAIKNFFFLPFKTSEEIVSVQINFCNNNYFFYSILKLSLTEGIQIN